MQPTISTLPLIQLASGDRLSLQVYKFLGAAPGKKVYIQSNLHGSEISGNAVIHQLIADLIKLDETQLTGEIWLVPVCNPVGVNQRAHHFSSGRYNSYDGKDWNRIFWDYEKTEVDLAEFARSQQHLSGTEIQQNYRQKILESFHKIKEEIQAPSQVPYSEYYRHILQSLCLDADYVIDLHSSTNQAIDYLYCFHSREESAKAFLLDYGILMNDYDGDAFDEAFLKPWLALEKQLSHLGKPIQFDIESWTLELGSGMIMNPESVEKGMSGIKNYLATKNLLKLDGFPLPETANHPLKLVRKSHLKNYYAPTGGMIQNRVELGSLVKTGQALYEILSFNKTENLPKIVEVKAESNGIIFNVSTNHSVNQCDYVLSIMEPI
ncbi:MAG: succinylglutamate desuccinylase/aspartoacylase family protein [Limnoraphis robusta]|uniref:Succinylglutamate desuccinylase n=1 Tax=Limnoraphis robusta CS-951 TaxID=1637645 RepID=A0A0F5YEU3_9CYAN|nr:succinylglutamate desuccinylase/aspartoacylase family protein [Limnoraphis robusta]KKD37401.1 succinylglutamate desuccinylase [Limnoraphis robusta CS-951]